MTGDDRLGERSYFDEEELKESAPKGKGETLRGLVGRQWGKFFGKQTKNYYRNMEKRDVGP